MRKNAYRTLAAAMVIGSMLRTSAWAESAVVSGSEVNLRAGPGMSYRIVDCLDRGTQVNVTDRSNGDWYAIEYDGETGFMSAAYLRFVDEEAPAPPPAQTAEDEPQPQPQTPVSAPAAEGEDGYINAMYVRFRSGPSSDYSILGEYNRGKAVKVLGTSGSWNWCLIDGTVGYIYSGYVSLGSAGEQPTPSPTQTPAPTPAPQPTDDPYAGVPAWAIGEGDGTPTPSPTPSPTPTAAPTEAPVPANQAANAIGTGVIRGDYVRFRTGPGTNYQIIDSYDHGQGLLLIGSYEDWTACLIDGVFGYVHTNYVEVISRDTPAAQPTEADPAPTPAPTPVPTPTPTPVTAVEEKKGYVSGNNVRMRAGASMSARILDELYYGNELTITGVSGDWTAVNYKGQAGFIFSQYVKEGSLSVAVGGSNAGASESGQLSGGSYEKGQQIAQFALQFVGYNYSWGGKDPSTGFDCSGLVYYTYQHFGYTLNRVAQDQARNGVAVSADELQPGDILCFYSGSSYIGHAGIYIGNGMFVHAQNSATGVVITELAGNYANRGFEARRIV